LNTSFTGGSVPTPISRPDSPGTEFALSPHQILTEEGAAVVNERVLRDIRYKQLVKDLDRLGELIHRVAAGDLSAKVERDLLEKCVWRKLGQI